MLVLLLFMIYIYYVLDLMSTIRSVDGWIEQH